MSVAGLDEAMARACRNLGRPGVAASAISAVDIALWDLKARLLGVALTCSAGSRCPLRSGGFTTYDDKGRPGSSTPGSQTGRSHVSRSRSANRGDTTRRDRHRVALARRVIGDDAELFVDANGAYSRKQAIRMGRTLVDDYAVSWFEEPVSSDDLAGPPPDPRSVRS